MTDFLVSFRRATNQAVQCPSLIQVLWRQAFTLGSIPLEGEDPRLPAVEIQSNIKGPEHPTESENSTFSVLPVGPTRLS